jgi:hypothetical protein
MLRIAEEPNRRRRPWLIVLSVVAAILIIIGILAFLALSDPGRKNAPASPNTGTFYTKLGAAALSREPAEISQEELNGFLSSKFGSMPPQCKINPDNSLDLYAPINYKGIRIGVTANLTADYNLSRQQLAMQFHSLSVGRLPVPPAFALNLAKDRLPPGISVEGDFLYADSSLLVGGDLSSATGVEITDIELFDGKLMISVAGDPDRFREFVVQSLPDLFNFLK